MNPELCSIHDPKTVLCYGDSNTFGHDCNTGKRFSSAVRWTGILQHLLTRNLANIYEAGLNGRTFATDDPQCMWLTPNASPSYCNGRTHLMPVLHSAKPVALVILALGVNDLKGRFALTPSDIANGCRLLINDIRTSGIMCPTSVYSTGLSGLEGVDTTDTTNKAPKILVIAPPPITNDTVFPDFSNNNSIERSKQLIVELKKVCSVNDLNVEFMDASEIDGCEASTVDGIHLTVKAHAVLGSAVADRVRSLLTATSTSP